jgi:hypothetical protein
MRGGQGVADFEAQRDRARGRQRSLPAHIGERFPLQEFEHQIVDAAVLADVEQRADVGIGQFGDRLGLAVEPRAEGRIAGQRRGQDLDGDRAPETRVACLVDLPHPARAEY